jgi:hypothetical protein
MCCFAEEQGATIPAGGAIEVRPIEDLVHP